MEPEAYLQMSDRESRHWWFVGRRAVLNSVLRQLTLPPGATVLEAGCGTGGNLELLGSLGEVSGFDPHGPALDLARAKAGHATLTAASLPHAVPFPASSFDLVAALDVLEHVEDDQAALDTLVRLTKPGGYVVLTVPTHPLLWGSHDRRLHHVRRYEVSRLTRMCAGTGMTVLYAGPFNTLLGPIAVVARLLEKVLPLDFGDQERMPPVVVNGLLAQAFALEARLVPRVRLPWGLSHVVVMRRSG